MMPTNKHVAYGEPPCGFNSMCVLCELEVLDAVVKRFPKLTADGAMAIIHAVGKYTAMYLTEQNNVSK